MPETESLAMLEFKGIEALHDNLESLASRFGQIEELDLDDDLEQHLKERGTYDKHIVSFTEIREVFLGDPTLPSLRICLVERLYC